jgi:hypothetical protein
MTLYCMLKGAALMLRNQQKSDLASSILSNATTIIEV